VASSFDGLVVDGNILSGVSSAVLFGRDLIDVKCIGWADKEAQTPLRGDHIFRAFSNTKLIRSCAALLLFEEGRFQLDNPKHGSRNLYDQQHDRF
jgi:CubicO group peptidase (beta-lactamase class C family)